MECLCGCGRPAPIAPCSNRRRGMVKGEPMRYVAGHQRRGAPHEYTVEDRGYTTPCWVWAWYINPDGYPRKSVNGTLTRAHRWYYEQRHGPLGSSSIDVHHMCEVRACVNPDHLRALPEADHIRLHHGKVDRAEVRARFIPRVVTATMLADEYGVSLGCIRKILYGERKSVEV